MTEERQISKAVISRLPRYYRYLGELMEEGSRRISSNELSARMKVTASQIRQDLNNFGGFGQQGYGYNVKYLYTEIARILGIDRQHNLIIIGAGNLGQAIANYTNFEKRGFMIKGMFDINPRLIGLVVRGVEIRSIDNLEQFIVDNEVQIAALTIPKSKAPEIRQTVWSGQGQGHLEFCPYGPQTVPGRCGWMKTFSFREYVRLSYRVMQYARSSGSGRNGKKQYDPWNGL